MARALSALLPSFCLLLGIGAAIFQAGAAARTQEGRHAQCQSATPRTIVQMQTYRCSTSIPAKFQGDQLGVATLVDLNPNIKSWYLLTLEGADASARAPYHLENPLPRSQSFRLDKSFPSGILIDSENGTVSCALWSGTPMVLEESRRAGKPYASLCDGRAYLRNPAIGKATRLEQATEFLREHIWGGDRIVSFVRREFYQDAFLEKGLTQPEALARATLPTLPDAPSAASLNPAYVAVSVVPEHLDIALDNDAGTQNLLHGPDGQAGPVPVVEGAGVAADAVQLGACGRDQELEEERVPGAVQLVGYPPEGVALDG